MDRRSWPWKKKSSDKTVIATDTNDTSFASAGDSKTDTKTEQDDTKSKYVQISVESYANLTKLEDEVVILNENISKLNEKVSNFNEKLSSAQAEIVTKDNLVKQHTRVAEEAVSGWEKAESEALTLKQQLESVTLLKLSAEDRASHLDGALKECMKQVRTVKEEGEQKLQDVVIAKTKQWENIKAEMEAKFVDLEQELIRSSADNETLSRTLQERSNLLMKVSDEKSQADVEIEVLKNDIHSCEREISSLNYELHVLSKENEIRSEEKNMSMRSAEVANKQHLEDVKKIAKLEAECQRLRGLVRKKLPGPAALAQMKLEVDSLGRDYGETRLHRSPAKSSSPQYVSPSDFALENMQRCRKENEFLTARMLVMEEEMKMLKEALSKRNAELLESRNMCAKTSIRLRGPPSLPSMSEDGIDEEGSCAESWSTASVSEHSHVKKEKNVDKVNKEDHSNQSQLELMDDFLEMERLACMSTDANESMTFSDSAIKNLKTDLVDVRKDGASELDSCVQKECNDDSKEVTKNFMVQELKDALSQIHDFVISIFKEATEVTGLTERIEVFSTCVNKVLSSEVSLNDFILALSHILSETPSTSLNILSDKGNEVEYSSDCVDKVTLLENKVSEPEHAKVEFSGACIPSSHSSTELEIERPVSCELTSTSPKCSFEEFEQLKLEKENMESDFARCKEMLELTNHQLVEMEQNLSDLKSQLAASEKSNSLAETQLKCMAESYKLLESQKEDLETALSLLHTRVEELDKELQEEKKELEDEKQSHQDDLNKYKELQDQIERNSKCSVCSVNPDADVDIKIQQEKEIAAAAEKLAECQETIFLLGKQLNSLRPSSAESMFSSPNTMQQISDAISDDNPNSRMLSPQHFDQPETENVSTYTTQRTGGESPLNGYSSHRTPTDTESISHPIPPLNSKHKQRSRSSSSSSSSSISLTENNGRGISRFFSKRKSEH